MKIDNRKIIKSSKNLNVLYVEDDAILRELTVKLLKKYFNIVDIAIDGLDAYNKYMEYYERTTTYYDILISDINMPNMDGLEMSKKIKTQNIDQAIILITAFSDSEYLHSAIELGVNGVLSKPIEVEQFKKVLYNTSRNVNDRKLVQKHYQQIEDNMLSIELKDSSTFNSARDLLEDLEVNKVTISQTWVASEVIHEKLGTNGIDVEYFRSHYAIKVIEYFLSVIKGEAKVGNCPVIMVMLDFFKHKNLSLEDVFMICVGFKNTISAYIFNKYSFNSKLFEDISFILDKNFEGVIVQYIKLKDSENIVSKRVIKEVVKYEDIDEKINYLEYISKKDIDELQDLEEDIDSLAVNIIMGSDLSVENFINLGSKIKMYGELLNNYPLFSTLGSYIVKLGAKFIEHSQILFDDKEKLVNISALVEGFVNDLIVWRKEIFENNIEDAHFLDKSFFINVETIIMFIEYDENF
ncbi:MAG: response regulator [Helicobacteraceae bacterium]|nr:response regulator [Helicobacteraceae bacterium]